MAQAAGVRAREGEGFHLRGFELGDGFGRAGHQRGKLLKSTGIQGHSSFLYKQKIDIFGFQRRPLYDKIVELSTK